MDTTCDRTPRGRCGTVTEHHRLPHPEPHEWVDEPDAATARAIDEALEDLEAGRSVVCNSDAAFDTLLAELASDPKSKAS
jgi:hypothetical protein